MLLEDHLQGSCATMAQRVDCTVGLSRWERLSDSQNAEAYLRFNGIIPMKVQHVSDLVLSFLMRVFGGYIIMAYVLVRRRDTRVFFIPKSGKISLTVPGHFRPIRLSSFY